jgi:prephenate dehydrogenase
VKLAVIGVGLIGGSFARAALAAHRFTVVVGYDNDPAALATALQLGAITQSADSAAGAARGADVVLLAVPVGAMRGVLQAVASEVMPATIVTDTGSTKQGVIAAAMAVLGNRCARFVPGHPIAGLEQPGVAASDPELFRGKLFITTPTDATDASAVATVEALWRAIGCRVERMDAAEHDRVFAAVSHLPHLLAFALVAQIAGSPDGTRKFGMAGAGFRDFTRIAASSPAMWRDICIANRAALGADLGAFQALLAELHEALDRGDARVLQQLFEQASAARRLHAPRLDAE